MAIDGVTVSTDLVVDGFVIPVAASRGINVRLSPIPTGTLRRTVNGTLIDLTLPQFRKYAVEIDCRDMEVPVLTGVFKGKIVQVLLPPEMGPDEDSGPLNMTMMVDVWQTEFAEWEARKGWRLAMLEI